MTSLPVLWDMGSDLVTSRLWSCPFHFRVSSFSDRFRVKLSVGSLLSSWYTPESISAEILAWYLSASRITLARPLSARRTMLELSSFRLLRASCCSFVMLGVGGCSCWRMVLTVASSFVSSSLTADSTFSINSVAGTYARTYARNLTIETFSSVRTPQLF